jgi:hypothetical protein
MGSARHANPAGFESERAERRGAKSYERPDIFWLEECRFDSKNAPMNIGRANWPRKSLEAVGPAWPRASDSSTDTGPGLRYALV